MVIFFIPSIIFCCREFNFLIKFGFAELSMHFVILSVENNWREITKWVTFARNIFQQFFSTGFYAREIQWKTSNQPYLSRTLSVYIVKICIQVACICVLSSILKYRWIALSAILCHLIFWLFKEKYKYIEKNPLTIQLISVSVISALFQNKINSIIIVAPF